MPEGRILKKRRSIAKELRLKIIKKCGPKCFYCNKKGFIDLKRYGKPIVLEKNPHKFWVNPYDGIFIWKHRAMHFDHVIPISKGGKDTLNNLVVACGFCNGSKGDKIA